ncbi:hypothetical protein I79_011991 [Cricetulus griseus]|uniref:Uncharacterized protein n=1 Tax=Cricetulus griseus TaxID=10029 RepID=G3HMM3_CRIGR|nr:hypothetical protein I79_011991 [Cricetulus griseus]
MPQGPRNSSRLKRTNSTAPSPPKKGRTQRPYAEAGKEGVPDRKLGDSFRLRAGSSSSSVSPACHAEAE